MNAPVKIADARPLLPVVDILGILAESSAASWALFPLELPDVVDPLQAFAERTKLVHSIGQDEVQAIMAAAFARLRATSVALADQEAASDPEHLPDYFDEYEAGYIARIVARLEADDAKRPRPPEPLRPMYRTPQSTINAFLYVARNESTEYLADWFTRHPLDVPHLQKIWKEKCTARST